MKLYVDTNIVAQREKADYVITRNEADFANSPIPAINPSQFFSRFQ